MKKKTLVVILIALGCLLIVLVSLFLINKSGNKLTSGNYGQVEVFELDYPEEHVIEVIKKLKEEDKSLVVPKVSIKNQGQWNLEDGIPDTGGNWYYCYFFDKEKNQIWFTWTMSSGENSTTFAFVSINKGLDLGNWQDVNAELEPSENKEVLERFELKILDRLNFARPTRP